MIALNILNDENLIAIDELVKTCLAELEEILERR